MALGTKNCRLGQQALVGCLAVAGMAIETAPLFIGLMIAAHLGGMIICMTLHTERIGADDQQMSLFTGMGIMALTALARHDRFMGAIGLFIDGLMTGDTEGVRIR